MANGLRIRCTRNNPRYKSRKEVEQETKDYYRRKRDKGKYGPPDNY